MRVLYTIFLLITTTACISQEQEPKLLDKLTSRFSNIDTKLIEKLDKQYKKTENRLTKQTNKWIRKLQKEEQKLKYKLARMDNAKAELVFGDITKSYREIENKSVLVVQHTTNIEQYIPINDSLQMAVNYLDSLQKQPPIDSVKYDTSIGKLAVSIKKLQVQFRQKDEVKKLLTQRMLLLKQQYPELKLETFDPLKNKLTNFTTAFKDYKTFLAEPDKLEKKLLTVVRESQGFKDFFAKNSLFNSIFGSPALAENLSLSTTLVQTRASIQSSLQSQMSGSNVVNGAQQILLNQMNNISSQIGSLKNEIKGTINKLGKKDIPEPSANPSNNLKRGKFWNNLEYGGNIQTQKQNNYFPVTSDVALFIGYKLGTKSTVGLGSSYKLGWGKGFENINITNQGYGFRTYVDIKINKHWWLYGGYEKHFENSPIELKINNWQQSGLIGLSRKISVKSKTITTQLLYDFLYKTQQPYRQPVVFRLGYILTKK